MQCMGNAIITFFMPFDPAPCDKKSRQNTRPAFREGQGTRLVSELNWESNPGPLAAASDELWSPGNCQSSHIYSTSIVGCNPTFTKNGRSGAGPIPGFVLLQKYCSPIRMQYFKLNIHTHLKFMHALCTNYITIITTHNIYQYS